MKTIILKKVKVREGYYKCLIKCNICGKEKWVAYSYVKKGYYKTCSMKCYGISKKTASIGKANSFYGKKHNDKSKEKMSVAKKGKKFSKERKEKMKLTTKRNENHPMWKGDKAGQGAMHQWIVGKKGKANNYICKCGKQAKNWSNKDHSYKRILEDYTAMCISCHRLYDYKYNLKHNNKIGSNQHTTPNQTQKDLDCA